jgi:hypothetical protein
MHAYKLHARKICAYKMNLTGVDLIPSPVTLLHFSVPISAQKLCEHFQKCVISLVEDCLESS